VERGILQKNMPTSIGGGFGLRNRAVWAEKLWATYNFTRWCKLEEHILQMTVCLITLWIYDINRS